MLRIDRAGLELRLGVEKDGEGAMAADGGVEVLGGGPTAVEGVPTLVSTPHSRPDKGKRKAVSESEAPKRMRRQLSSAPPVFESGPSESNVFLPGLGNHLPSITIYQGVPEILCTEVGRLRAEVKALHEEAQVVRQEQDEVVWVCNTLLRDHDTSLKLWEVQAEEIK
ncbi:hypothetical protein C0992_002344 [Termitomyces sp. T32_za158]|nr:hypothetical protein C0992_002344 [Termitomyces sp. T32_za158]